MCAWLCAMLVYLSCLASVWRQGLGAVDAVAQGLHTRGGACGHSWGPGNLRPCGPLCFGCGGIRYVTCNLSACKAVS